MKGLIFCSRIEETIRLSEKFNERGYHTIALNGSASEAEREEACGLPLHTCFQVNPIMIPVISLVWNFVLSCPHCNNQKRDKLADHKYLDLLINRNDTILIERQNNNMRNYQAQRLLKIYDWAKRNGCDEIWSPKQKLGV